MYASAKDYKTQPSKLAGIDNEVAAYCFDRGIRFFGKTIENDIEEKTRKVKKQDQARAKATMIFGQWMTVEGEIPKGVFREPPKMK